MARINFNNRDPIYLQVMEYFKKLLVSDQLELGEELPSRRQIARELNINPNTVQRAFSEMEEKGWIYTEPNRPSRVTQNTEIISEIKQEFVRNSIKEFVTSIQTIDISFEEVTDLLLKEIKTQNNEKKPKDNGGEKDD